MTQNILAIDSSTQACSVALNKAGKVFSRHEILPQKHAHRILPMIDEVIQEAGINSDKIDFIAFGEGPGAFTGIRIAAGVIQGLALGWNKAVVAVNSLSAIAEALIERTLAKTDEVDEFVHDGKLFFAALVDARMHEVYLQSGYYDMAEGFFVFNDTLLLSPEQALVNLLAYKKEQGYASLLGAGDAVEEYPSLKAPFAKWSTEFPNAISLTRLAATQANSAQTLNQQIPVPLYLRNKIADTIEERKLKKQSKVTAQ